MSRYLNASNLDEIAAADVAEYPLPYDPDTLVRIKSVSLSRMGQFQETANKPGSAGRRAQYALIADSVVDESDNPVWTSADEVERIGKSKTRLIVALIKMIEQHNGGNDKLEAEQALKNSSETN